MECEKKYATVSSFSQVRFAPLGIVHSTLREMNGKDVIFCLFTSCASSHLLMPSRLLCFVFTALFAVEVCFNRTPPEAGALQGNVDKSADQFSADQGEHHRNPDEWQIHGMK
jgi:hypothetical protein